MKSSSSQTDLNIYFWVWSQMSSDYINRLAATLCKHANVHIQYIHAHTLTDLIHMHT